MDMTKLSKKLYDLRTQKGFAQEKLAEVLGVSRQSVQKWENGGAIPSIDKLVRIADFFDVSLDYLISNKDNRSVEQLRTDCNPLPSFDTRATWEAYYKQLPVEYQQSLDEGKDIEAYKDLIFAVSGLPNGKIKSDLSDIVFEIVNACPNRRDYPYDEPSDLEGILDRAEKLDKPLRVPGKEEYYDRMKGAFYGRICGCLLGKPVEGMRRAELIPFLQETGNYPMHRYITQSDVAGIEDGKYRFSIKKRAYVDGIMDGMPIDDDTNYIILAYLTLKRYGRDFTPANMMALWLDTQPKNAYCTAERVAFRNFVDGFLPPESAIYKNPYREWIGAQIRGDFFGWVCPGDPQKAASMAWSDASISHVKNGIYGEMWVSAMLAAAGAGCGIEESLEIGLKYIPAHSRLHEAIEKVIAGYRAGKSADEFFEDFHTRWNDRDGHHWCHTISNAEIVAASLLYGGGDYEKSICLAVGQGFDTDCNGATVGSVVGLAKGFSALPEVWTSKINDTLFTSIFGFEKLSVSDIAEKSIGFTTLA